MVCPYRKMTKTVDDTTREYYMECHGEECPFYVPKGSLGTTDFCNKAEGEIAVITWNKPMRR